MSSLNTNLPCTVNSTAVSTSDLFEVYGSGEGTLELHTYCDDDAHENITELTPAQADDLIAQLIKARKQMTH